MKLTPEQFNILERIIDKHGVIDTVNAAEEICDLKSAHAGKKMKDVALAGLWRLNAFRLSQLKLENV